MNNEIILVVEDEEFILNNICTILELNGYECIKAINGKIALEKLKSIKPHLIICDVMMPEMDGFELLKTLKISEEFSKIPFCILSARADVTDINKGLNDGANAYITKPFLAKELLTTVNLVLTTNIY